MHAKHRFESAFFRGHLHVRDREVCTQHIASRKGAAVFDSNRCQPADLITAQPAATEALRENGQCWSLHYCMC
jgi:hypothetical protein